jgi:acyl dehydratase
MTIQPAPLRPAVPAIRADIVGREAGPRREIIDARWLMAYAAGAGAQHPCFFDTTASDGPLAHPLFAVCYEWPLMVDIRAEVIGAAAAPFGVHASHHLVVHRLPRAGDQLSTRARVTAVSPRRSGTLVVVRLVTADQRGQTVSETDYGSFFRGVSLEGAAAAVAPPRRPAPEAGPVRWSEPIAVPSQSAHIYTECARIWNPIHTDLGAARAAGLPGPILHGTATLALAVSRLIERELASEAALVRGIAGRFTGMVPLPSTMVVRARERRADGLAFDVVTLAGLPLISEGVLHL